MRLSDSTVHFILIINYISFSQPDDAAVFLLFLRAAKWLVGVEVPGETEPEDAATVAAGIGEGIDGIVGRDVPAAGVEHVGDEGR